MSGQYLKRVYTNMGTLIKKKKRKLKKKGNREDGPLRKKKLKKKKVVEKKVLKKKKLLRKKPVEVPEEPKGRWCTEKVGALPFPIECHYMHRLNDTCKECTNPVNYRLWKAGAYIKVEDDIDRGIDFTDPNNEPEILKVEVSIWSESTTKLAPKKLKKKKKGKVKKKKKLKKT